MAWWQLYLIVHLLCALFLMTTGLLPDHWIAGTYKGMDDA